MTWWRRLESDLYEKLQLNPDQQYWDLNLAYIKHLIDMVEDEEDKSFFESRYRTYLELNSKRPVERSEMFSVVRGILTSIALNLPATVEKVREELGMWESSSFRPPSDERDFTESEAKAMEDEKTKIKAEWIKKSKKKKWGDDEEKKMADDYSAAIQSRLSADILACFTGIEEKDAFNKAIATISTRKQPTVEYFSALLRKKPLRDLDIEGKRILLRAHLRLSTAPNAIEKQNKHIAGLLQAKEEEIRKAEEEKAALVRLRGGELYLLTLSGLAGETSEG